MKNIIEALLKFQNECPKVTKDSSNPYFKSKYADLASIWETIQPLLNKLGLVVIQPVIQGDVSICGGVAVVKTIIYHLSGESVESTFPIVAKNPNNPQDFLAAVTYARRGALQSILSIVAEDDDGNTAAGNSPKVTKAEAKSLADQVAEINKTKEFKL